MYTQSPLEEQLNKGDLSVGWPWRFFALGLVVFMIALLVYFGMSFGLKAFLNSEIESYKQKKAGLEQSIDIASQEQLIKVYSQYANIKNLTANRKSAADIFDFLEKNTYSDVSYTSFSFNIANRETSLYGVASDHQTFVKQVALLEDSPMLEKVVLDSINFGETGKTKSSVDTKFVPSNQNEVRFGLKLTFKPEIFK